MAIIPVIGINKYIGASSDSKSTAGVPAGSIWEETDTGTFYIFNGSAWVTISSEWVT